MGKHIQSTDKLSAVLATKRIQNACPRGEHPHILLYCIVAALQSLSESKDMSIGLGSVRVRDME